MEEWKPIGDTRYSVSNLGNVKNHETGRIMSLHVDNTGYVSVAVKPNRGQETKQWQVHRYVAKAFVPNPDNLPYVNHIDGNKLNNTAQNLEWCTNSHNQLHRNAMYPDLYNRMKHDVPVKCSNGKTYPSIAAACRDLGLHHTCVKRVLDGAFKQTGGYTFEYV